MNHAGTPRIRSGPDSWYSWVVAFSCMLILTGTFGIFRAAGVIFVEIIHVFDVDRETASWPFTISGISNSLSGVLAALMTSLLSVRQIAFIGVFLSAAGLGFCYFASTILWISISYGVFFGTGCGLLYTCLPLIVNEYCVKKRTTGNGILLTGTPVGVFLFGPLSEILITVYSLRGSYLMMAAVCVQTFVFAALLKPLPGKNTKCVRSNNLLESETANRTEDKDYMNQNTSPEEETQRFLATDKSVLNTESNGNVLHSNFVTFDSTAEIQRKSPEPEFHETVEASKTDSTADFQRQCKSLQPVFHETVDASYIDSTAELQRHCKSLQPEFHETVDESFMNQNELNDLEVMRDELTSDVNLKSDHEDTLNNSQELGKTKIRFIVIMGRVKRTFINPIFFLLTTNYLVVMFNIQMLSLISVDFGKDKGMSRRDSALFLSVMTGPEIICRLCSGWITDNGIVGKENSMAVTQIISGIVLFLFSLCYNQIVLYVLMALCGVFTSFVLVLQNVLYVEYFEKNQLGLVYGIRHTLMVLNFLSRPWIIGFFRDTAGSYDYLFQTVGGVTVVCGVIWFIGYGRCRRSIITG